MPQTQLVTEQDSWDLEIQAPQKLVFYRNRIPIYSSRGPTAGSPVCPGQLSLGWEQWENLG